MPTPKMTDGRMAEAELARLRAANAALSAVNAALAALAVASTLRTMHDGSPCWCLGIGGGHDPRCTAARRALAAHAAVGRVGGGDLSRLPKLVRDRVPDEIGARGAVPTWRVAAGDELRSLLFAKLREEAAELEASPSAEEMADVLDVAEALARSLGIDIRDVESARKAKFDRIGAFRRGVVLEAIDEPPADDGPGEGEG